jgi:hypothetical protein
VIKGLENLLGSEIIVISNRQCIKVDEWYTSMGKIVLGNDISVSNEKDFYLARLGTMCEEFYERPTREQVEDFFIDKLGQIELDEVEAGIKPESRVDVFKKNFNRAEFFKTELGGELDECIKVWDLALENKKRQPFGSDEYRKAEESINWCGGMFEGFKTAFRHFYGVEINFSRTDDYFGICIVDDNNEEFFLTKIDRKDFEEKYLPRFQKEPTIKERAR